MGVMSHLLNDPKEDSLGIEPEFYAEDRVRAWKDYVEPRTHVKKVMRHEGTIHWIRMPGEAGIRPSYDIKYAESPGRGYAPPSMYDVPEANIELIERGNHWKHLHGEPVAFNGIVEEADFYVREGDYEAVEAPYGGWTMKKLMKALKRKQIDYFINQPRGLGDGELHAFAGRLVGHPETSERIRNHHLEVYKDWRTRKPKW